MSDPYVFHFEARRDHAKKGELLSTLAVEPAEMRRIGPRRILQMVESERLRWLRIVLAKLGAGWSVVTVRERGYVRSVWSGAALRNNDAPAPLQVPNVTGQRASGVIV